MTPEVTIVPCDDCGSEGRILRGWGNDPDPRDYGPCQTCEGTGMMLVELEEVERP